LRLLPLVLVLLPLGALGQGAPAAEAEPEAESVKGADLLLLEEVRRIARNVETVRQERFVRPPIAVRVPDDLREAAAEIRASNVLHRERLVARGRAWADIGLGEPEAPLDLLRALAADLPGIGFDPEGNRLLVSSDHLTARDFVPEIGGTSEPSTVLLMTGVRRDEPLIAHLLTHVRQRERTGLDPLETTTDLLLATMVWSEGEASLVAMRYLFRNLELADVVLEHALDPGEVLDGALLPAGLNDAEGAVGALLRFIYLDGFDHAAQAYREGGWEALAAAARARRTTRDVLHPELGAVPSDSLSPLPPPAIGRWVRADEDVLGEQAIVVLVSTRTGKDNLGLLAGDGWIQDRLVRWEPAEGDGPGFTEWLTRWTTDEEAADFTYALGRTLEARFPGRPIEAPDERRRVLSDGGRVYRFERDGSEVRVRVAPAELDARLEQATAP
jgi:hypothetical protein